MMEPSRVAKGALCYEFSIEDHVRPDHVVRAMDRFVNLGDARRHLAPFYNSTGRPSGDPALMIRMLIVGCAFGIWSERRLCEEVHLNIECRWFRRLDLSDPVLESPSSGDAVILRMCRPSRFNSDRAPGQATKAPFLDL